jgi:hypothetical protein
MNSHDFTNPCATEQPSGLLLPVLHRRSCADPITSNSLFPHINNLCWAHLYRAFLSCFRNQWLRTVGINHNEFSLPCSPPPFGLGNKKTAQSPVIFNIGSGRRAPSSFRPDEASLISLRSASVSSTLTAPRFSSSAGRSIRPRNRRRRSRTSLAVSPLERRLRASRRSQTDNSPMEPALE